MTNSSIGWCDVCDKEVGYDHDCKARLKIKKLSEMFKK